MSQELFPGRLERRFRVHRLLALALGALLSAATLLGQESLSPRAVAQIQSLLAEKASRTPAQRKIESNLLFALRQSRGLAAAPGVGALETGISVAPGGEIEVEIRAEVGEALLDKLSLLGARVLGVHPKYRSIRARLRLDVLETLAGDPAVLFIQPKQDYLLSGSSKPTRQPGTGPSAAAPGLVALSPGFVPRALSVRSRLAAALSAHPFALSAVNVSEGDLTHRAALARSTYGVTGAGVKIGVLSDGVDSLASLQASGDLPADVTVLPGQAGGGNEGSAMLEIVHDLAPLAKLYFATAFNGIASFAQNIEDLRTAGCDIIIDDVFYFVETPFQKGQAPSVVSPTNAGAVIEAVNTVAADGALYFSSASNSGNLDDGQSGTWEGDFVDGGAAGPPISGIEAGRLHNFGGGTFDTITVGAGNPINLSWSDPLGASANDYDLFVLDGAGSSVVAASTNLQNGSADPYEQVGGGANVTGNRIVILKFGGATRALHLGTNRGRVATGTAGETHGHAAAPHANAFGVAAVDVRGPYPSPFSSSDTVETFSSDGPRRYFYNANSTAITPGNVLFGTSGGQLLNKPDVTAADGVSCAAPGFNPFFGTSAAAPHAGAIAGLVKSGNLALTPAQIKGFLTSTAIDIEAAGTDRDSGAGILDAFGAVQASGATPKAFLLVESATASEANGNGNSFVEPGECGSLAVQLTNGNGTAAATAISATIATATPGVTILSGTSGYSNLAGGASGTNLVPFDFSLANTVSCPLVIDFVMTITFAGGDSPEVVHVLVRTGVPAWTITTTLDATVPPTIPGATSSTGLQTTRLSRNNVGGECDAAKAFPGTFGTGTRRYDAYAFTNCSSGTVCFRATLRQDSGTDFEAQLAVYAPTFDPTAISTDYLADFGGTAAVGVPVSTSFQVAGGTTFVVVVNELDSGGGIGAGYTLTVDGLCLACATFTGTCSSVGPRISGVTPSFGPAAGGTLTTISGSGFQSGATVTFGGAAATGVTFVNATKLTAVAPAHALGSVDVVVTNPDTQADTLTDGFTYQDGASFFTLTPCRVLDTRNPVGALGGPALAAGTDRVFPLAGTCGIPSSAKAISINVTITGPTALGDLRLYPAGGALPSSSTINYRAGQTRANNAAAALSASGALAVRCDQASGTVQLIIDVNGYFQ